MNNVFYYPITIRTGNVSTVYTTPYVDTFPALTPSDVALVVLFDEQGKLEAGLYFWTGRNWMFTVPYVDICEAVIDGSLLTVATALTSDVDFGSQTVSAVLWRNGQPIPGTVASGPPSIVWGVKVDVHISAGTVTSVDGQAPDAMGNVVIQATDANAASGTSLIGDSGSTTGNIKLRTLVPGNNINITQDANGNLLIASTASGNITEVSSVGTGNALVFNDGTIGGVAQIKSITAGQNITITQSTDTETLTISANQVLLPATTSTIGGVIIGTGFSVDGTGLITLVAPVGANLGGVKAGTGLAIASDGTISAPQYVTSVASTNVAGGQSLIKASGGSGAGALVKELVAGANITLTTTTDGITIASTSSGNVTSVDGLTGDVIVEATDTSTASGTSLISDSGATTGNIKIKRLVPGSGITLTTDANGNLQVSSTATGGVSSFTAGTSGQLTGDIVLDAGTNISLSNVGNTIQISGTGVPEAPNDGNQYARQNLAWSVIPDIGNAITSVTGQTGTGAVLLVEDSPPANSAIIKSLVQGSNVTIVDNDGLITISASIPGGTVATVNGIAPNSSGNVTLTAANVNAVPIAGNVTMTGPLNMGSQVLTGLTAPVNSTDAVNLATLTGLVIDGGTIG